MEEKDRQSSTNVSTRYTKKKNRGNDFISEAAFAKINEFYDDQDKRLRERLPDPKTFDKIRDIWYGTLYEEYNSKYEKEKNTPEYKKLKELEKEEEKALQKASDRFDECEKMIGPDDPGVVRRIEKAHKKYLSSKEYKDLERIRSEIRSVEEKLGGMKKVRTVNDILKMVTPEMRDEVYDFLARNWYY